MTDNSVAQLRIPPHSAEAEAAVLGSLLLDGEALHKVPGLVAEAFFSRFHADVFRAVHAIAAKGKPFDVVTVYDHLKTAGVEAELSDLSALAMSVASAGAVRRYAEIVLEKWQLRQLISAGDEIVASGFSAEPPTALIDKAQMKLARLATVRKRKDPQHITQSLPAYLALLQDLSEGKNPAMPTGIHGLDRVLNGGLRRGEMMVIGARPKHGKTALALALARNMAHTKNVLFISQEMPILQLMHRHTAALGSIDLGKILRADPHDERLWNAVTEAAHRMERLHLVHDEQAAQSLMDVRRKAIQVKRQHGLDVIFVDFLQLMQGGSEETRNRELDLIANGIKALALDLDIGAVLLSQMTREADKSYQRPVMTFLRDSGAIEAAADQIALLHTDHAHPMSKRTPPFAQFSELEIVAHRNGPQGLIPLRFVGEYQQIGDWDAPIPKHPEKRGGDL
jgi:replicative DNA helicase